VNISTNTALFLVSILAISTVAFGDEQTRHQPAEIVIKIKAKPKPRAVPQSTASQTTVSVAQITHAAPGLSVNNILDRTLAGASINPDNSLRIRGVEDDFSLYLDGAPLQASVSGSVADVIDPKDIQYMRIYTGGFPAEYGNQLGAVMEITTKSGRTTPGGSISQSAAQRNTFVTEGDYGGSSGRISYLLSGSQKRTGLYLSPLTQTPYHDDGSDAHGFIKLDFLASEIDRFTLQLGTNAAEFKIPNTPDRQAVGQDDREHEGGTLANLIWRHQQGYALSRVTLYTHSSHRKYDGSPADLVPFDGGPTDGLVSTFEDVKSTYIGIRADQSWPSGAHHQWKAGFDLNKASGRQQFTITSPPDTGFAPLSDNGGIKASNVGLFVQEDWTTGRFQVNYGVRFDQNSQDITTNQVSPRLNIKYRLNSRDTAHAYYNRLFQPVAAEDVKTLVGQSTIGDNSILTPIQPERDNFYEIGLDHAVPGLAIGFAAYYKTGQNVRDDDSLGNTQISVPINNAKAYFRGFEFSITRQFSNSIQGYANYALAWSKNAGPVTGGSVSPGNIPPGYFYDDHDQTHTGKFGLSFDRKGIFANLTGEYGSGQPYGEILDTDGNAAAINIFRVPPHFTLNLDIGKRLSSGLEMSFYADNLLNHPYIVKQADVFSSERWDVGRIAGVKISQNF
jgi:outer membrane receptor protein involved in Fe transport